jgi:hypothetical protein
MRSSCRSPRSARAVTFRASWSRALGLRVSKSEVSPVCEALDEHVKAFRTRRLEGRYPYVFLDAEVEKVRDGGRVVAKAPVIAHGVHETGRRARSSRSMSVRPRPRSKFTRSVADQPDDFPRTAIEDAHGTGHENRSSTLKRRHATRNPPRERETPTDAEQPESRRSRHYCSTTRGQARVIGGRRPFATKAGASTRRLEALAARPQRRDRGASGDACMSRGAAALPFAPGFGPLLRFVQSASAAMAAGGVGSARARPPAG